MIKSFTVFLKMVRILLLRDISVLNNKLFDVALKKAFFQTDLSLKMIDIYMIYISYEF